MNAGNAAERRAPLRGSQDELQLEDRRRNSRELIRAWQHRAAVLELKAKTLRAEGDLHGPHSADDYEAAAQEWRAAADVLQAELLELELGPADFRCRGTRLEPSTEDSIRGEASLRRRLAAGIATHAYRRLRKPGTPAR